MAYIGCEAIYTQSVNRSGLISIARAGLRMRCGRAKFSS